MNSLDIDKGQATPRRMKFHQRLTFVLGQGCKIYKTKSTRKKHIERDKDNSSDEKTQEQKRNMCIRIMGTLKIG